MKKRPLKGGGGGQVSGEEEGGRERGRWGPVGRQSL